MHPDLMPRLQYCGDVTEAVGQEVGPTPFGEMLVVDRVDYDPVTDRSEARLRYRDVRSVGAAQSFEMTHAAPVDPWDDQLEPIRVRIETSPEEARAMLRGERA